MQKSLVFKGFCRARVAPTGLFVHAAGVNGCQAGNIGMRPPPPIRYNSYSLDVSGVFAVCPADWARTSTPASARRQAVAGQVGGASRGPDWRAGSGDSCVPVTEELTRRAGTTRPEGRVIHGSG